MPETFTFRVLFSKPFWTFPLATEPFVECFGTMFDDLAFTLVAENEE